MCGIIALSSYKTLVNRNKFIESCNLINHRGPDQSGYVFLDNISLGHKRLSVIDLENGKQPMTYDGYSIVYNGELYNTNELRELLVTKGYEFNTSSDTEVLLKMFHCFKEECVHHLNGIFSFIVTNDKEVFAFRDRLGVKPLYYTIKDNEIMLASEMKVILNYYDINTITKEGLIDILTLGPSHTPGNTPYKDVYELREGSYLKFDKALKITRYWNVYEEELDLSFEETKEYLREILEDAIKRQLVSDVPLATFLSGGVDSSIITAIAALNKDELDTYSVDYENQDKAFKANKFQKSNDQDYIKYIVDMYNTNHLNIVLEIEDLVDALEESLIKRDLPGMADIDSSLLLFAKAVKESNTVCLSGECADELLGGYPWFEQDKIDGFPWLRNIDERIDLLNDKYKELDLKTYLNDKFLEIIKESNTEDLHRQMLYINIKYFMQTLLERKDRMTMGGSLEVRVPFADHRVVEFLYNVPHEYKKYNGIEKGLLREAFKDVLPNEIYSRRKSPYPKTHSEEYLVLIKEKLNEALNEESILLDIFNKDRLLELINNDANNIKEPWFGQLMTGPQLLAYLYQFHLWGKLYNIKVE